jgi:thiol-disulfide isomerase/thioredoxin
MARARHFNIRLVAVMCALWAAIGAARAAADTAVLQLPSLDGSKFVQLTDFTGRPMLLNFWGSECPPCVRELPLLAAQAMQHPGVQFLGIAVDERTRAEQFLAGRTLAYPQLIATSQPEVLLRRFGDRFGALPFTVVLNARHEICTVRLGEVDAGWVTGALQACGRDAAAGGDSNAKR